MGKESVKKAISSNKVLTKGQIEAYKKRFASIDASLDPGRSFYYLFDHNNLTYIYVSEGMVEIMGLTGEELNSLDGGYLRFVHEDDLSLFGEKILPNFRKIRSKHLNIIDQLTFQIMGRIRRENGEIVGTLLEYQILEVDEDLKAVLSFGKMTELRFPQSVRGIGVSVYEKVKGKTIQHYDEIFPFGAPKITTRELEILKLIADGKTGKKISEQLYISENTVKNHRQNMLRKLGLKSSSELVRYAIEYGLTK